MKRAVRAGYDLIENWGQTLAGQTRLVNIDFRSARYIRFVIGTECLDKSRSQKRNLDQQCVEPADN